MDVVEMKQRDDSLPTGTKPLQDQDQQQSSLTTAQDAQQDSSESEVFDRIAGKLLRSGLLLTALELHAELIERGKESSRLRDFFNDLSNFEKHCQSSPPVVNRSVPPPEEQTPSRPPHAVTTRSPSEQTFDSLDFTHYSDEDGDGLLARTDERIAVLEFELRKARQTIDSLRASLTMSTTGGDGGDDFPDQLNNLEYLNQSSPSRSPPNRTTSHGLPFTETTIIRDYVSRGSADGDSCPGEDDQATVVTTATTVQTKPEPAGYQLLMEPHPTTSKQSVIKPHEKRALNYLINEYLMYNGYKLTSITFCDENTDQDFDTWDDVGLNVARPPDLLRLYRNYWKSQQYRSSATAATLMRSNSNATTVASCSNDPPTMIQ